MPTFAEFATVLDGRGHGASFRRRAYAVFVAGERQVFYPRTPGAGYVYVVDGGQRFTFDAAAPGAR